MSSDQNRTDWPVRYGLLNILNSDLISLTKYLFGFLLKLSKFDGKFIQPPPGTDAEKIVEKLVWINVGMQ